MMLPDAAMPLSELARRRGVAPETVRRNYEALVAAGMPRRLPGLVHWKFQRAAAEAWLAGRAAPRAANDDAALDPIVATRAALAAEYGRAG